MSYRSLLRRIVTRIRRPRHGAPPFAIFLYHAVVKRQLEVEDFCFIREEEFRLQVDALRRRFRLVPLEEGARLLAAGELREPTASITFDDGFQDNFEVAYPVLREAGVPATIFVCTDLLDTSGVLWYCRLHDSITRTGASDLAWDGRRYPLHDVAARFRAAKELKNGLKRLPPSELEAAVDEIAVQLLPRAAGNAASEPDPRFRMLSRTAVRTMAQEGLVDFGAHTGSHAILAKLDRAAQRDEIERSVREVSALAGKPCRTFAYPNGRFEDYDRGTIDLLREAGVSVAVTAEKGWNETDTPGLELLRFAIGGEPSMPMFEQVLARYDRVLEASVVTWSGPSLGAGLEHPAVSVVVPVRNAERTVGACVDSLLALEYPRDRVELIAVDNGSNDGTRAILESYAPALRVLDEPVRGAGAARNRGVERATHPLVAFTDADCRVDGAWLRHLVAPLHDPTVGVAGGRILANDPSNPIERFDETLHDHERAMTSFRLPYAITMSWASRAQVLRRHTFDPAFLRAQDSELAYRLVFAGYRLVYVADAIVRHHNRSTPRALFHEGFQSGFWAVAIFRKHHAAMRAVGSRRFSAHSYRVLFQSLIGAAEGREEDGYSFLFQLGRKLGLLSGSIRFGCLRL